MPFDFLGLADHPRVPLFLAPQAGVSESPFRRLCRAYGADVVSTEFVSARGIVEATEQTRRYLRFDDEERPIGIQIFGSDPATMADAAALVSEVYEPDFVDINFGCPVKKVVKRNGGSACLRDLDVVYRITRAVADATYLPVTTKIRSGFDEESRDPVTIGLTCQEAGSRMVTLHPRTREDMYGGRARWHEIRALREALSVPVVGNGDVRTGRDARRMWDQTGCHGIMIARGSHGSPWLFAQARAALEGEPVPGDPDVEARLRVCLEHARNAIAFEDDAERAVIHLRKHLGWYTKGLPDGRALRAELHRVTSLEEIEARIEEYLEAHQARRPPAAAGAG